MCGWLGRRSSVLCGKSWRARRTRRWSCCLARLPRSFLLRASISRTCSWREALYVGARWAVRSALGAGRGRLLTQFMIESLVLAGLGAIAGLALAIPFMRFLETLVPETMAAVRL